MMQEIPLEQLIKEHIISQRTDDKVIVAKNYIERTYNLQTAKNKEWNEILEHINLLQICPEEKQKIKKEIYNQEVIKYRKAREKQTIRDYESLAIIGRGAFGEVHVCREKKTGKIYAIKKIKKQVLIIKNQIRHVINEQIIMSKASTPWIVELKASFQEGDYLYLVMEYLPGGDLMNLLIEKDILTEKEAKFYISELILAVESIHNLDCIHRDIKPDNILIDKNGHIKLSDFGLAKISDKLYEKEDEKYKNFLKNKSNDKNTKMTHNKNFSCVGTAYYVAPEVLKKSGYDKDIDWWSVGIILYEMLVGYAPFCSKETTEVCYKVLNWKNYLKIPKKIKLSEEVKDLIFKMIKNSDDRLGKNGAEEIKKHPFFKDVDWDNIRNSKAPFIPELKNEYDTKYFEKFEVKEPFYPKNVNKFKRKDAEYVGYEFNKDNSDNDLKTEYEQAIKMINKELKQEKNNINENNIYNDENISLNISSVDNTLSQPIYCTKYNNKKNKIERTVLIRNKPKISFQRSATTNNGRKISSSKSKSKFLEQNQSINNIKGKINKNLEYQCTIPISYHKKHKLNIIQLPKKKSKPKIYLSSKIMNLLKDSKSTKNTLFISDDSISKSNNNTYRSMRAINNNKNISKKFNKIPTDSSKAIINYKLTIGSLIDNLKKILSPKQKENIFVKKPLSSRNTGFSIDRIPIKNNNIRGNSFQNNKPKYKFQKLEKPRVILKPTNLYVGRNKSQKNNLKMNNSDKYNSKSNIFFNGIYRNLNHEIGKVSYIYKKKK
jgi:serine/threonine kinase 38